MRWLGVALLIRVAGVGAVSGVVAASAVAAQSARPCPPATREPYLVCQVDRAPRPDSSNKGPRYPEVLLQAAVSGALRVSLVVEMSGRVDPASFTVMDSAHALFTAMTKEAVQTWKFDPAMRGGRAVPVRWEQIVAFSVPRDSELPSIEPAVLARDMSPDGVPRMVIGIREREPSAILLFTNRELLAAQRGAFAALAPQPIQDSLGQPRVTLCLTINRGGADFAADSATLAALTVPGRRAVIPRDCPPTYTMRMYDTTPRPAGYIDPYLMDVTRVIAWNADVLVMQVDVAHETATNSHRCWTTRGASASGVTCRPFRHSGN